MGNRGGYTCRECNYEADVAGGATCRCESVSVTIICRDCRELHDVQPDQNPQTFLDSGCVSTALTGLACPVDPSHRYLLWYDGDPCPRCGAEMRLPREPLLWD